MINLLSLKPILNVYCILESIMEIEGNDILNIENLEVDQCILLMGKYVG